MTDLAAAAFFLPASLATKLRELGDICRLDTSSLTDDSDTSFFVRRAGILSPHIGPRRRRRRYTKYMEASNTTTVIVTDTPTEVDCQPLCFDVVSDFCV